MLPSLNRYSYITKMAISIRFAVIGLLYTFLSIFLACDPPLPPLQGTVKLNVAVSDTSASILLGDTLAFHFEVPDTVVLIESGKRIPLVSKDYARIKPDLSQVDSTIPGGFIPFTTDYTAYAAPGNWAANALLLELEKAGNRLLAVYYVIPKRKGVYFLRPRPAGMLYVNDGQLRALVTFDFGSINKHHDLIIKSAGAANKDITLMIDTLQAQGYGTYGFEVR
jgi:hypothetical protein